MTTAATWGLTRLLGLAAVAIARAAWWVRRTRGERVATRQVADRGGGQRLGEVTVDGRCLLLGLAPGAAPRLPVELDAPEHPRVARCADVDSHVAHLERAGTEVRAA